MMRRHPVWWSIVAVTLGALWLGPISAEQSTASSMAEAAGMFLDRLEDGEGRRALLDFDADAREDWHFIPKEERKGLPLKAMRPDQGNLAHSLLASSLSRAGYGKAVRLMSLEKILFDLETAAGANRFTPLRQADGYYFSLFGDPRGEDPWGWSVEGHHVSLNYTVVDGRVSSTPAFFGANPHEVPTGRNRGLRLLGAEEDAGRAMLASLRGSELESAILGEEAPSDIFTSADRRVDLEDKARGLPAKEMNADQRALLKKLIEVYIGNVPRDLAARRRVQMDADFEEIRFGWMGPTEKAPGNGHYYRVLAPTFLIEYDNVQGNANHSHTVWREYDGDFGRDLLREHRTGSH